MTKMIQMKQAMFAALVVCFVAQSAAGQDAAKWPPALSAGRTSIPAEAMRPPVKPVAPQQSKTWSDEEIRGYDLITKFLGDPNVERLGRILIESGKARRDAAYQRQVEEYRSDLELYRQRQIAYDEFQRDLMKRRLELQNPQQEIEAGKKPHTETVDGKRWQYDPITGKWTEVTSPR
jgi:hypothetical protein